MIICIDFLTIWSQEHSFFEFYFLIFICKALNIVKNQQRQLKMDLDFTVSADFKDYRMPKKKIIYTPAFFWEATDRFLRCVCMYVCTRVYICNPTGHIHSL